MNNHLLVGLLVLQAVSVASAFDPDFYDVEYRSPYKLRGVEKKIEKEISRLESRKAHEEQQMEMYAGWAKGRDPEAINDLKKTLSSLAKINCPGDGCDTPVAPRTVRGNIFFDPTKPDHFYHDDEYISAKEAKDVAGKMLKRYEQMVKEDKAQVNGYEYSLGVTEQKLANEKKKLADVKTQFRAQELNLPYGLKPYYYRPYSQRMPFAMRFRQWITKWYK